MDEKVVSVDDDGVVRILDSEKFQHTEKLAEESSVFLNSTVCIGAFRVLIVR